VIVVDASVVASAVGDDTDDGDLAREVLGQDGEVCAPDLVDVETVAVLRKRWLAGTLTVRRFAEAVEDLQDLPIDRYPTLSLMWRAYELRDNVTAYDASYVGLAEALECPLVTGGVRLSKASGIACDIHVLRVGA
jgi:predicted nucleic acid-binding protein